MMLPYWTVFLGPIAVAFTVAFCAILVLKRLNYYTSVLLQNAVQSSVKRDRSAIDTADAISQKLDEAAGLIAQTVQASSMHVINEMKEDLKGVHVRLHKLEGSVAHKEAEIVDLLDAHPLAAPKAGALTPEAAARILGEISVGPKK